MHLNRLINHPHVRITYGSPAGNVSFHARSCKQRGILHHHVLAPFFFPPFPRSLSADVFFFPQLYRSTSYERMTNKERRGLSRTFRARAPINDSLTCRVAQKSLRNRLETVVLYGKKWSDKMLME